MTFQQFRHIGNAGHEAYGKHTVQDLTTRCRSLVRVNSYKYRLLEHTTYVRFCWCHSNTHQIMTTPWWRCKYKSTPLLVVLSCHEPADFLGYECGTVVADSLGSLAPSTVCPFHYNQLGKRLLYLSSPAGNSFKERGSAPRFSEF